VDVTIQPSPGYLTVTEAAVILAVSERTVYNALRANRLKGKKVGKLWRTTREWLDEFGRPNFADAA
jgi:excisionase family DNA binding protein